ncbi:hypothetical protein [Propionicicella superfundia]|uniref:hypothetical protein n=1 Tax=Propionicicella superfundia TaxID=348582 RepID=UPI000425A24A|nr:hypothetical protein [Propionicicella superfundia]
MGKFKGTVVAIGDLVAHAQAAPEPDWAALYGSHRLRNDAAGAAAHCAWLVAEGDSLASCWRFGILQTVDYYDSAMRRGGVELAGQVFAREPAPTGAVEVDAAFAALAEHLAVRDGWEPPVWSQDPARRTDRRWYVAQLPGFRAEADKQTPPAFGSRGVFISANDLSRA